MNNIKSLNNIQGILSIGYVYLIVMGILNETLYYQQIGIDILKYSSILDILISPIARLTSSILSIGIFMILIFLALIAPKHVAKGKDKRWFKKVFKFEKELNEKETASDLQKVFLTMLAIGLFGFYVGTGLGKGFKAKKKIKNGEITYIDKIRFINGESDMIKILGSNNSYVFYLLEGNESVQITPISGVVQRIEDNKID